MSDYIGTHSEFKKRKELSKEEKNSFRVSYIISMTTDKHIRKIVGLRVCLFLFEIKVSKYKI